MLIARRNAMMAGKRLPYDAEVEYLESTGTQWIDTGVVSTSSTSVRFDYELTQVPTDTFAAAFGSVGGQYTEYDGFCIFNNPNVPIQARTGRNTNPNIISDVSVTANVRYAGLLEFNGLQLNGRYYYPSSPGVWSSQLKSIGFFTANDADYLARRYVKAKFYGFSIGQYNALVRDFIPVRFTNEQGVSEGAMYNKLGVGGMNPDGSPRNDGLYRNRGKGAFVLGPDI